MDRMEHEGHWVNVFIRTLVLYGDAMMVCDYLEPQCYSNEEAEGIGEIEWCSYADDIEVME